MYGDMTYTKDYDYLRRYEQRNYRPITTPKDFEAKALYDNLADLPSKGYEKVHPEFVPDPDPEEQKRIEEASRQELKSSWKVVSSTSSEESSSESS
jgi:hypothetical protein